MLSAIRLAVVGGNSPTTVISRLSRTSVSRRDIPAMNKTVESRLYSDGLFSFAINITPADKTFSHHFVAPESMLSAIRLAVVGGNSPTTVISRLWLPAGMKLISQSRRDIPAMNKTVESRLYSDGLFSFHYGGPFSHHFVAPESMLSAIRLAVVGGNSPTTVNIPAMNKTVESRLYSDGLFSFAINITPADKSSSPPLSMPLRWPILSSFCRT
jgi:negative regulator of sigma E activity